MSTRCLIGIENKDGSISHRYCHHDGYPTYVGYLLCNCYPERTQVEELIKQGDMSSLGENIQKCEFYHRDEGEELKDPGVASSIEKYVNLDDPFIEYYYVYTQAGQWIYTEPVKGKGWKTMDKECEEPYQYMTERELAINEFYPFKDWLEENDIEYDPTNGSQLLNLIGNWFISSHNEWESHYGLDKYFNSQVLPALYQSGIVPLLYDELTEEDKESFVEALKQIDRIHVVPFFKIYEVISEEMTYGEKTRNVNRLVQWYKNRVEKA